MKINRIKIILILIVLALGVIYAVSYINSGRESAGKLTATSDPAGKFAKAVETGKPVFLEFYGAT
ncbi:hypothetical protein [Phosphitispora sp. TUW77]|uniref:hypothetical protein n=1 Tax=Phosphitispora sp. TUW77 TaxID=3152361 RepID=UPI003AB7CF69